MMRNINRKEALRRSGFRCAFPDCPEGSCLDDHIPQLEVAFIRSQSEGGARHEPGSPAPDPMDNLIVLCPKHHRLIDWDPHRFSAAVLRELRTRQQAQPEPSTPRIIDPSPSENRSTRRRSFTEALAAWNGRVVNKTADDEEFWQSLFSRCPEVLALAAPGCVVKVGEKCFVGGKDISNTGGNVVDYLMKSKTTSNLNLVEIKTPNTRLVGSAYRGVFTPSRDIAGAVIQVLGYKNQLLKDFYALSHRFRDIEAINPQCLLIAGDLGSAGMTGDRRHSFELFRTSLSGVVILTYDELFTKVSDVVSCFEE
jgi:hypothetical protein